MSYDLTDKDIARLKLETNPSYYDGHTKAIVAKKGDINSRLLCVDIYSSGKKVNVENFSSTINVKMPTGKRFSINGQLIDEELYFKIYDSLLTEVGDINCDVSLYKECTNVIADTDGSINYTDVIIDEECFIGKVGQIGTYIFEYNGQDWTLNSEEIILSEYGVDIVKNAEVISGDKIIVSYSNYMLLTTETFFIVIQDNIHSESSDIPVDSDGNVFEYIDANEVLKAIDQTHVHSNTEILDNTTASFTNEHKDKLEGIDTNLYVEKSVIGKESGVASLDENGIVPDAQLPSFVKANADWTAEKGEEGYIENKPIIPEGVQLYNTTGENEDGSMTQKATTEAITNYPATVFAETERQKSKNWCYLTSRYTSGEGVTITVDEETQIITIKGTSTTAFDRHLPNLLLPRIKNCKGKTFTVIARSVSEEANDAVGVYLGTADDGQSIFDTRFADFYNTPQTFTISDNYTYDYLLIYAPKGNTYNKLQIQIQIEEGTEATDWQYPYGQIAHSNDTEVTFARDEYNKSKNLWDSESIISHPSYPSATYSSNNDTYSFAYEENSTTAFTILPYNDHLNTFGFLPTGEYTLSFNVTTVNSIAAPMIVAKLTEYGTFDTTIAETKIYDDGYYVIHFVLTEDTRIGIAWYYNAEWLGTTTPAGTKTLSNIQLEKGNNATDYQKYNGEIIHEKDLFDYATLDGNNSFTGSNVFAGNSTFNGKFIYSAIEKGTTDANRCVWFNDNATLGKPVYNNNFMYNPSTNVLTCGRLNGCADYLTGFKERRSSINYGALKDTDSYTYITQIESPSGGSVAFADNNSKTYMALDGTLFVNEGNDEVATLSGAQTITGEKTFTSDIALTKSAPGINLTNTGTGNTMITLANSNYKCSFGIGNGLVNRGFWDITQDRWIIYCDSSRANLNSVTVPSGQTLTINGSINLLV